MISKDIKNLTFVRRNISVTHDTPSCLRAMSICAMLGQALVTAVAQSVTDDDDICNIDEPKLWRMIAISLGIKERFHA